MNYISDQTVLLRGKIHGNVTGKTTNPNEWIVAIRPGFYQEFWSEFPDYQGWTSAVIHATDMQPWSQEQNSTKPPLGQIPTLPPEPAKYLFPEES